MLIHFSCRQKERNEIFLFFPLNENFKFKMLFNQRLQHAQFQYILFHQVILIGLNFCSQIIKNKSLFSSYAKVLSWKSLLLFQIYCLNEMFLVRNQNHFHFQDHWRYQTSKIYSRQNMDGTNSTNWSNMLIIVNCDLLFFFDE